MRTGRGESHLRVHAWVQRSFGRGWIPPQCRTEDVGRAGAWRFSPWSRDWKGSGTRNASWQEERNEPPKGDVRAGCGRATADPRGGSFLIRDQEIRLGGGRGGAKDGLVRRTRRRVSTDLLYLIVDPLSRVWTGEAAACPQPKNAVPFKRNGNSAAGSLELFEGLLEVQDHIPSVLDANREAHQVLPDPEPLPPRRRARGARRWQDGWRGCRCPPREGALTQSSSALRKA